jgi:hypothetical protein
MQKRMADNSKFPRENPFKVPEGYFDTIEDRIEERIRGTEKKSLSNQKFILILKPILGLAASFALAFLLIYYPISKILPWYTAKHAAEKTEETKLNEELIAGSGYLDERTFFLALTAQENPTDFESDEIISFLTSELNDYEIYAEIMN